MVYSVGNHAEQILLRIAVRINKNAVRHPHWQRRDIARRHDYFDAGIKHRNEDGLRSSAACAGNANSLAVDFRAR